MSESNQPARKRTHWLGRVLVSLVMSFLAGLTVYYRNTFSDPHDTGTVSPWRPDHDWKEALFVASLSFVVLSVMIWRAERTDSKK